MTETPQSQTPDSPTPESPTPTIVEKPKRLRKQTLLIVAGVLVVVAALGWGAFATWQKSADEDARTSALDSGRQFATDLATYNFQNLDQNLSVVRDNSVGEFAGQYAQVAANLQNMIVQYQATSSAQIISAGLASSDRDNARCSCSSIRPSRIPTPPIRGSTVTACNFLWSARTANGN
ncbi:hypothetical protein N806_28420 [Rhodococcus sp. P27]|nr:hypothetical protein N806_28420 [Rhodococcus sp. P27]